MEDWSASLFILVMLFLYGYLLLHLRYMSIVATKYMLTGPNGWPPCSSSWWLLLCTIIFTD